MNLPLRIALRYLFSPKRHNAVNIISLISVAGIAVAAAAMVVVLSVFNGFAELAYRQISRIDPPLKVSPSQGKVISNLDSIARIVSNIDSDAIVFPVISDQALAASAEREMAVKLLGVPTEFIPATRIDTIVIDGLALVEPSDADNWTIGLSSVGVALGLNVRAADGNLLHLFVPRRKGRISTSSAAGAFRSDTLVLSGVYQVEQEAFDSDMLIVPIETTRRLLDYPKEATSLWIYPGNNNVEQLHKALTEKLGTSYIVANRLQQQAESFRMINVEKWITFLMLAFILVISSFNIISTMAMLIIEKENNSETLSALGASNRTIRRIFATEGFLISLAGGMVGIIIGVALCLVQETFGIIKLHSSNVGALAVDTYPVAVSLSDIGIVAAAIVVVGIITAIVSSWKSA